MRSQTLAGLLVFFIFSLSSLVNSTQVSGQVQIEPTALQTPAILKLTAPMIALRDVAFELKIEALDADGLLVKSFSDTATISGILLKADDPAPINSRQFIFSEGTLTITQAAIAGSGTKSIQISCSGLTAQSDIRVIPGILSLLPPLFAIALAFVARQVLVSLFSGIWLGAFFIYGYDPVQAFIRTIDTYLVKSLADVDHASVLIFSLTLGGMVGVISKAGGTQGIVQKLSKYARNRRGGQIATWAMGLLIFFDDYANTLIVGNTMRSLTDRLKISREKLSYIVDSTAAPVASVALVSTWIGFQIGLIDQAFKSVGSTQNAYGAFLQSIPYSTYSILAMLFVLLVAVTLRDFGPMWRAESRTINEGKVLADGAQPLADTAALDMIADEDTPLRWQNALIPIAVVIAVTLGGLYVNGKAALGESATSATLGQIFGEANSFRVLMWAAFTGLLTAIVMAVGQKILKLNQALEATVSGYKSMMMAAMILIQAWAIGSICNDLHTADYVIDLTRGILSPHFIPFATFIIAAFISFSTGASWATMAILTPIMIPIAYKLPVAVGLPPDLSQHLLIATIGAILSGSVLGDHCSPISDTTILSSMASAADHVDHVRTQMPYAILVGGVASVVGYLPAGWGMNGYLSLLVGAAILSGAIFLFGKKTGT